MTTINNLSATEQLSGSDQFPVYSGNGRTKQISAYDMSVYFNEALKGASISFNQTTKVITMTLGDGFVITGTVTS